jgi:hypothetical protein
MISISAIEPCREASSSEISGITDDSLGTTDGPLSQISIGDGIGEAVPKGEVWRGGTIPQPNVVSLGEEGLGDAPGELFLEDITRGEPV